VLAEDRVRSVRLEAAGALLQVPREAFAPSVQTKVDAALQDFVAARTLTADQCDARLDLAQWARQSGKLDEAEVWLKRALERDPSCSPAYLNLADLYRERGDDQRGLATLEKGMLTAADVAVLHHAIGLTYVRLHEPAHALAELKRAHDLAPERSQFGFVYAIALFDTGEQATAINVLKALHDRRPGDAQILQALIQYLKQTHQDEAAASFAERLGEL
jgi:predicted Zn-dependent protease